MDRSHSSNKDTVTPVPDVTECATDRSPSSNAVTECATDRSPNSNAVTECATDRSPSSNAVTECTTDRSPSSNAVTECATDRSPSSNAVTECTNDRSPSSNAVTECTNDRSPSSNAVTECANDRSPNSNAVTECATDRSPSSNAAKECETDRSPSSNAAKECETDPRPKSSVVTGYVSDELINSSVVKECESYESIDSNPLRECESDLSPVSNAVKGKSHGRFADFLFEPEFDSSQSTCSSLKKTENVVPPEASFEHCSENNHVLNSNGRKEQKNSRTLHFSNRTGNVQHECYSEVKRCCKKTSLYSSRGEECKNILSPRFSNETLLRASAVKGCENNQEPSSNAVSKPAKLQSVKFVEEVKKINRRELKANQYTVKDIYLLGKIRTPELFGEEDPVVKNPGRTRASKQTKRAYVTVPRTPESIPSHKRTCDLVCIARSLMPKTLKIPAPIKKRKVTTLGKYLSAAYKAEAELFLSSELGDPSI